MKDRKERGRRGHQSPGSGSARTTGGGSTRTEARPHPASPLAASTGVLDASTVTEWQRAAGNTAVVSRLSPDTVISRREATDPPAQGTTPDKGLSYAFFFVPESDPFGRAAHEYIRAYYPDHRRYEARSFEQLFKTLGDETAKAQKAAGETPVHVDEIIIVSHANAGGSMMVGLTDDTAGQPLATRDFSPAHVAKLQQEANAGLHRSFTRARTKALGGIDRETRIIVRGCELGKDSAEPLDALAVLFGGQPVVMAPRAFQGFQLDAIGQKGGRFKTAVQAYDWLVAQGYLSQAMADATDKDKTAYIAKQFPRGVPSEFFLVGEEAHKELFDLKRQGKALGEDAERIKTRVEDPANVYEGLADGDPAALWAKEHRAARRDTELALPLAELARRAEALMASYKPTDAPMFLRLWEAYQRQETPDKGSYVTGDQQHNPLVARPEVFNDENVRRARRDAVDHPDPFNDAFGNATLRYAPEQANAHDFTRSQGMGIVDPATVPTGRRAAPERTLEGDAAVAFWMAFGDATTEQALKGAPVGESHTGDASVDAALADLQVVVALLRRGITLEQLPDLRERWRRVSAVVRLALEWAHRNGYDPKPLVDGSARVNRRIDVTEVAVRSRTSEAGVKLPHPGSGVLEQEAAALSTAFERQTKLLGTLKLWDTRHAIRASQVSISAANLEASVKSVGYVRSAVGWAAVWSEFSTLDERLEAAKKKGLISQSATVAKMVSHATSALTEATNVVLGQMASFAKAQAAALAGETAAGAAEWSAAWKAEADALKSWSNKLSGIAGVISIISGSLDLIEAIHNDDPRAARAAVHTIAQGVVSVGAVITGAGAAGTAAVSGSLTVVWATIEAIAIAADNIRGFERLKHLDEIKKVIDNAESLVPWGKRMAGVGDAWEQLMYSDPDRAQALADDFLARAREPFGIVVSHMLAVAPLFGRAEFLSVVTDADRAAIADLERYRFTDLTQFAPGDLRSVTDDCMVLFRGLQRMGADAVKRLGPGS